MTDTDYAVAPGEYLNEWIADAALSQVQAAELLGYSLQQLNEIVNGRAPITDATALLLEQVVGVPASTWLRYETTYRADLVRIRDKKASAEWGE